MSEAYVVLVRGDDGPDPYGPYDEDNAATVALWISEFAGLETEVVLLQPWGIPNEVILNGS